MKERDQFVSLSSLPCQGSVISLSSVPLWSRPPILRMGFWGEVEFEYRFPSDRSGFHRPICHHLLSRLACSGLKASFRCCFYLPILKMGFLGGEEFGNRFLSAHSGFHQWIAPIPAQYSGPSWPLPKTMSILFLFVS